MAHAGRVSFKFSESFQERAKPPLHAVLVVERDRMPMIFRAIFWIGLVSLLMPREPDLGLGRPGAGTSLPSAVTSWAATGLSRPGKVCEDHAAACAGGLALFDSFQSDAIRGLAAVKADIEADRKARAASHI
jgi:hypothetical protein